MRMRVLFMAMVLALAVGGGCVDEAQRHAMIETRVEQKVEAWIAANPATPFTMGQRELLRVEAVQEVDAAIKAGQAVQKAAAKDKILEAAGHAASGNYVAAGYSVVMAALLFFGIRKASAKPEGGTA